MSVIPRTFYLHHVLLESVTFQGQVNHCLITLLKRTGIGLPYTAFSYISPQDYENIADGLIISGHFSIQFSILGASLGLEMGFFWLISVLFVYNYGKETKNINSSSSSSRYIFVCDYKLFLLADLENTSSLVTIICLFLFIFSTSKISKYIYFLLTFLTCKISKYIFVGN